MSSKVPRTDRAWTLHPVHARFAILMSMTILASACTPSPPATRRDTPPAASDAPSPSVASATASTHSALTIAAKSAPASALVVMLHGVGADAASFHDLARTLSRTLPGADFVTPDGFHPFDQASSGYQWFSLKGLTDENRGVRIREAGQEVSRWIDQQLLSRGLRGDRLAVVGFSQGAMLAAWLAVHRSPAPAAIVMFSGRVLFDDVPAGAAVATPVFMAHGADDMRIPVSFVDPGARVLESWGARVSKHVYPRLGHTIDGMELAEAAEFLKAELERR